jgi:hypothetical protein
VGRHRARLALGLITALLATPACGSDPESASSSTTARAAVTTTTRAAPTGPLDAGVRQYREDEAAGILQIQLHNVGDDTLQVTALRLDWNGLGPTEDATPDYPLAPGVVVDLPVAIGHAMCEPGVEPSTARAVVGVIGADGQPATLAVAVTDGFEVLARVHERLCNQEEIAEAVDIRFGETFMLTPGASPPAATGSLVLNRRGGDEPITVQQVVDGGVLLDMTAAEPVVTLAPGTPSASGAVTVTSSGRCDAHALGESKKTYEFRAQLTIGDDAHAIDLQIPLAAQPTLFDVIELTCG